MLKPLNFINVGQTQLSYSNKSNGSANLIQTPKAINMSLQIFASPSIFKLAKNTELQRSSNDGRYKFDVGIAQRNQILVHEILHSKINQRRIAAQ